MRCKLGSLLLLQRKHVLGTLRGDTRSARLKPRINDG
jgi:hypothetical protein